MNKTLTIIVLILAFLVFYIMLISIFLYISSQNAKKREEYIIELFFGKVNKIPALIEIMKKHVKNSDTFTEIIYLHKLWIIYNIKSIYDLLDLNNRLQKEFSFLMKISAKTPALQRDWNFLHIRNYIMFYESNLKTWIEMYNLKIEKYNRLIWLKNASLLGFLIPIQEKIVI